RVPGERRISWSIFLAWKEGKPVRRTTSSSPGAAMWPSGAAVRGAHAREPRPVVVRVARVRGVAERSGAEQERGGRAVGPLDDERVALSGRHAVLAGRLAGGRAHRAARLQALGRAPRLVVARGVHERRDALGDAGPVD